jgi:tetratricopeptide (TPR) repeat protein
MSQKKETGTQLSQESHQQIQDLFSQYHQIAERLHNSTDQAQAEAALADIAILPAPTQLALVKTLARENTTDAADVLAAIHALGTHKDVRKEARRGLIRLEATKTYAQWKPYTISEPAAQPRHSETPRFWKGLVTQSRDQGEIQVVLCWEEGYEYNEVRVITFTLNYWQSGVTGVNVETMSKRRFEQSINKIRANLPDDVPLVDCTLPEAKRLIEEALSVNQWYDNAPDKSYRNQLPLINKLILQAASDLGEDRGHTFITPELEDEEVIINFLGAWSYGDYGLAYDLLTHDSSINDSLSRDEWIERHRLWHQEAHPARLRLGFVHEREGGQSPLWLPASVNLHSSSRKNIEVGWSVELNDTPLSGTLKEMPISTAVNKETGRHWFWITYTVVREEGGWRIQQIIDEGLALQSLSIQELQSRIKEYQQIAERLTNQQQSNMEEAVVNEVSRRLIQMLYFYDVLLTLVPLDYQIHQEAYAHAHFLVEDVERLIVYLNLIIQHFPEKRAATLCQLSTTLLDLTHQYDAQKMPERVKHLIQRADETVREAITIDDNAISHLIYGELLMHEGEIDKAEAELYIALEKQPETGIETIIEAGLGDIAMTRKQMSEAIPHYKRVAENNPQHPGIWFKLGSAHRQLGKHEEAEKYYQQAIKIDPHDVRAYHELAATFIGNGQLAHARAIIEQGVQTNPQSAYLHALLASLLFEQGEHQAAQRELAEAEQIDPELEIVQVMRQHIHSSKRKQTI